MPADLASILAGNDPTAVEQAQAYNQQLLAAAQLAHPSSGIFAGLNNALAMGGLNQVPGEVSNIAQQKVTAQPDLASALASPDPYQYAAANPNMNPIALAHILQSTPLEAAQTRGAATTAGLQQLTLQAYLNRLRGAGAAGATAPGTAAAPGGVTPVGRGMLPASTTAAPGTLGSGRYTTATAAGAPGAPDLTGGAAALPVDPVTVPPAQLPAFLQRLNPTQRAMAISRLRMNATLAPAAPAVAPGQASGGVQG